MKIFIILALSFSAFSNFLPHSFRVELTETSRKIGKKKSKSVVGKFDYKYPGHVRYKNQNMEFVANKELSWRYEPPFIKTEKGSVFISKKNKNVVAKLFDVLKSGLNTNSVYKVTKSSEHSYFLDFTKSGQNEYKIKSVVLTFDPSKKKLIFGTISRMSLTYTDNKLVDLYLKSFDESVSFNDDYFVFKVPSNTKEIFQ